MSIRTCVLRNVAGIDQYVAIEDSIVVPGETIFLGEFNNDTIKCGPSDSDSRTICLPDGAPRPYPLTCCYIGVVAPSRDWVGMSGPLKEQGKERVFIPRRLHLELLGA